jgi:hypothetical protein
VNPAYQSSGSSRRAEDRSRLGEVSWSEGVALGDDGGARHRLNRRPVCRHGDCCLGVLSNLSVERVRLD